MFKKNFIKLCNKKGVAPTVVCLQLGISKSTFSYWDENSIPREATLQKIADYFGISVETLLKDEMPEAQETEEYKKILIEKCDTLNKDEGAMVAEYIDFVLSKREKKD